MSKYISATYSEANKTVEYLVDDGGRLLRIKGSMAWRFQNPGAMESTSFTRALPGWIGEGVVHNPKAHLFAIFDSYENGREGNRKLLQHKYKDSNMLDIMKKYAVSGDGANNPKEYAAFIVSESGITDTTKVSEMSDAVLDKVLDAIQKKEGYIPGKEKKVNATNVSVTDGVKPVPDCPLKVTLGTCEYDWKTNEFGDLPPIIHMSEGMNIEIKATNSKGEKETIYSATAGNKSKNILLTKKFTQYKADTLAHNPKVPHEKSQPQPIEYIVQSGDVLSKIATRYDVSASELAENNGIKNANKIYPGQKIIIYGKKEPDYVDLSEQAPWEEKGQSYPVPSYSPSNEGDISGESIPSTGGWNSDAGTSESAPPGTGNTSSDTGSAAEKKSSPSEKSGTIATTSSKPASSKTRNTTQKNKEKLPTIGSKNSGNPVAILPYQNEAPWMVVAYEEAENRWKWGKVKEANGGINYHKVTGASNPTMVGNENAWCASFINYCLKISGYKMSGSPNSQSFSKSPDFIKIDTPIFGAITVFHKKGTKGSGHVNLVYCRTKDGEIGLLGGNQMDSVTINPRYAVYDLPKLRLEFVGFYVPVSYYPHAKEIIKKGGDLTPVFDNIDTLRESLGANKISEKDGKTR